MNSILLGRFSRNQWVAIVGAAFLLLYAIIRAISVPVVFDEVFTFMNYVSTGRFQPFYARLDANNHLINSTLAHLSYGTLGPQPFPLRLPNVLALGLYLYYLFRLRVIFTNENLWLCFFIGLSMIHYLFDFFSLCRGYGLSFAFLTGGLFHVWQYASYRQTAGFILSLCFLTLAVWSNLSLMVIVLCIGTLLIFHELRFSLRDSKIRTLHLLLFTVLFIAPIAHAVLYSIALKDAGMLFLGEGVSLNAAIGSGLIAVMFGRTSYQDTVLFCLMLLYLVALALALSKRKFTWPLMGFHLSFISALLGVIALHLLLDVNYPVRRAAMHLPWLWLISFFIVLDNMPRKLGLILGIIPTVLIAGHFLKNVNVNHVMDWGYECVPHSFLYKISTTGNQNGRPPIVSCNPYMSTIIGYQSQLSGIESGITCGKVYPSNHADFNITSDSMIWDGRSLYDTADFNPATGIALMQRKESVNWQLIEEYFPQHNPGQSDYLLFTRIDHFNKYAGKAISVEINMTLQSYTNPVIWSLYSQIWNNENECLKVNEGDAQMFFDLVNPRRIRLRTEIFPSSADADHMRLFIQPHDRKSKIEVSDIHIAIYAADE